jgi:hypothetical protein
MERYSYRKGIVAISYNGSHLTEVADSVTVNFKLKTKLELQNIKLTENPPFFIHAVSGWAFHKTN